ncbi:ferredoxin reductase [Actinoallomurus sp. NBC_01490]|uniref:ferredoxin reductase n=1 Tax=Actinoallomurus sp. NBC_01490 TaxID=2903557 RepID=UPI002E33D986|nr:ferredoxin reductase [Actinoallomurus sp. NBC_01490]
MALPTPWQTATVTDIRAETRTAKTFRLELADPRRHLAGQHYVVRLTAPDGYRAQRSYSVASAPDDRAIELTVELLPGGEVSGFLHEIVEVGDELEVRGPIGGFFAWDGESPILGVAGGSGVVPLMSMLRHSRAQGHPDLVRLVVSVRTPADLYYAGEITGPETTIVHTRQAPAGSHRPAGRLSADDLKPVLDADREIYVCGSPGFCDGATTLLLDLGVDTHRIRVERFGPTR